MLQYLVSDKMLVDYFSGDFHGNFDFQVPEDHCAFLQLSDGRKGFFAAGKHSIPVENNTSLFRRNTTAELFWFNLSDHIEIHLSDTIRSMEQLLKTVIPELKTYHPLDLKVNADITVQIEDKERLLEQLLFRQSKDINPVLDTNWLRHYLEKHLHYQLEESVNRIRTQYDLGMYDLSDITDEIEADMIEDVYNLLHSMSLDLVAFHISRITPDAKSLEAFKAKESEALTWYNQIQMEQFAKRSGRSKKASTKAAKSDTSKLPLNLNSILSDSLALAPVC